jgi:uncharacterized protein (TIGR00269 family)
MVKCVRCGSRAAYYVSYVRGGFCRDHYLEYIEDRVVRTIERYKMIPRGSKLVVAISGGKDSVALLHILVKRREEIGYGELVAVHINLGIPGYSEEAERVFWENCRVLNVRCIKVDLRELLGVGIPDLSRLSGRPPCSVCGLVKRYVLNAIALVLGADVLATGHHLDDMLVYMLKDILSSNTEELSKLTPVSKGVEGLTVTRIRPLFEVYEENILNYAIASNISFVAGECPLKHLGAVEVESREYIEKLERRTPGFKLTAIRNILRMLRKEGEGLGATPSKCQLCGMPSRENVCSFCKLTEKTLGKPMGRHVVESLARIASLTPASSLS